MAADWIVPDWPAPSSVKAMSTTRTGGVSVGKYATLNLGDHVGDVPAAVAENRRRLRETLKLPHEPRWLKQVHGTRVARLQGEAVAGNADAALAQARGEVCAILTADCLPVLFCNAGGTEVGAAHAGWRGLAAGVLESIIAAMSAKPEEILVWLGPAIGSLSYEVGNDVRRAFVDQMPEAAAAFLPGKSEGKWWCDLYRLARERLRKIGVTRVYGGGLCTYSEPARFFSFRRDGECGRMATLIYIR
ncbi:MAG: peptidoglycan editing factor PgeF [Bacillota bacterium]